MKQLNVLIACVSQNQTIVKPEAYFLDDSQDYKKGVKTVCKSFSSGKERSKFHKRIATAMAQQWTEYLISII